MYKINAIAKTKIQTHVQYQYRHQDRKNYHQHDNLVNSRLSVVGLQVFLYLRLARSKPAKTAVATWQDLFKMETKTNTKGQPGQHYCCKEAGFFFHFFIQRQISQSQKLEPLLVTTLMFFWLNIFKSKEGEKEHTVKLVKSSNLLNKRVDDMTM